MRLENKVIIITGSARGLGKAYALALAKEGASIVVADILGDKSSQTASEIQSSGGKAIAIRTDISLEKDANSLAEQTMKRFGRIDVLVNNAAMLASRRQPFYEISVDEWDRLIAVNVRGTWLCTKSVFPYMKEQHGGKIVNIASGTFFAGVPFEAHYVASKGAIVGFTRAICRELGQYNITVNALAPGYTETEGVKASGRGEEYASALIKSRSLKRSEVPSDP